MKQLLFLLFLPTVQSLVDCVNGFVGRMQASVEDNFFFINDTRMCAAAACIKVTIYSAVDDDYVFQQGVSSRCAYTGGDRQICGQTEGGCSEIQFYEGMKGNFTFCCCKDNYCNMAQKQELEQIFGQSRRRTEREFNSTARLLPFMIISAVLSLLFLYLM